MTSAGSRRVDKLEAALPPREAVLAWLVEAQAFPSFEHHMRHVVEVPVEAAPMSIVARQVEAAVRASMKGRRRDEIDAAVRRSIGDAMFLFCLVFVVNIAALEFANGFTAEPCSELNGAVDAGAIVG